MRTSLAIAGYASFRNSDSFSHLVGPCVLATKSSMKLARSSCSDAMEAQCVQSHKKTCSTFTPSWYHVTVSQTLFYLSFYTRT